MSQVVIRALRRLLVLGLAIFLLAPAQLAQQTGPEGSWQGEVKLPNDATLKIEVEFKKAEAGWTGTIDIPHQGAKGLALKSVSYAAPSVSFQLEPAPGQVIAFEGRLEGSKIAGTMAQAGMSLPFKLERRGVIEEAKTLPEGMIPREVLFGNPERATARISPDGKLLAYLAPNRDGVLNVWARTIGKEDDQVVTNDKKRGVRIFTWDWTSENIIYL